MKAIAQALSFLALGVTLLLPCLFFADQMSLPSVKTGLLVAAAAWFLIAPFRKVGAE